MKDDTKNLLSKIGFEKEVENVDAGRCPFCGEIINMNDFTDTLSIKEFHISGLCQRCQDNFFGK